MRIGIIFGGPSREREVSFAGGRTVYDNLDKTHFEAVPIFVDSLHNFIILDWQHLNKGTIRDFYPPSDTYGSSPLSQGYIESHPTLNNVKLNKMINQVGKRVSPNEFKLHFDFAFLCLHGKFGEDGAIQGLLESLNIPYSGSGILPSSIGMDKAFQKRMMTGSKFNCPAFLEIDRDEWLKRRELPDFLEKAQEKIGDHVVIRPANQGSSIGVTILKQPNELTFQNAVDQAFFVQEIKADDWKEMDETQRESFVVKLIDIRDGLGTPLKLGKEQLTNGHQVLMAIEKAFRERADKVLLEAIDGEETVVLESFISGKEFSCIVIKDEKGKPVALPPTEIVKGGEVYNYRSKYLPGLSRKVTPIDLPDELIQGIRKECCELFKFFGFHVYARIDGFINEKGEIFLNDPNTTSGMLPSSFFFHQAAEIGLNPSQFISYIIWRSLKDRLASKVVYKKGERLLNELETGLKHSSKSETVKKKIAVLLGGMSSERHISVESGRNIYEKLASSSKYEPIPIFLTGTLEEHELHILPINILLKDNADDIQQKISAFKVHPLVEQIKRECSAITEMFGHSKRVFEPKQITYETLAELVDGVFIALHGRPGEDGNVQQKLDALSVPYNGSRPTSAELTINKFRTNQLLKAKGVKITKQQLISRNGWLAHPQKVLFTVEDDFDYPLIAKPVDDGCSSAVKLLSDREELAAYLSMLFRETKSVDPAILEHLKIDPKEEIPIKETVLIEKLIQKEGAKHFLEITGGLLTHYTEQGEIEFEVFMPSEALSSKAILSLEEKFLAGQGQNITPARFSDDAEEMGKIGGKVRTELEKVACILQIEGYARIDAFVRIYDDLQVETIIVEVNSLPGMTPAT